MLSSVTLDGADGVAVPLHSETGTRQLKRASGLVGIGSVRTAHTDRPTAHGGVDESEWESGRLIVLDGEVWSQVSQVEAYAQFRTITAPMIETLDKGPTLLKWTEGATGLALQRMVKLAGDVDPPLEGGAAALTYQAQFYAEDPRAYSQTETAVIGTPLSAASGGQMFPMRFPFTFTPSSGGVAACVNAGNRPTPAVFRIYGYLANPSLELVESRQRIVLNGAVAEGTFIDIGTTGSGERYIRLGGVTSRNNFLNSAASDWFELPKGTSTVRLLAENFDANARLEVFFRSAYA